jgi:hypothetical protein
MNKNIVTKIVTISVLLSIGLVAIAAPVSTNVSAFFDTKLLGIINAIIKLLIAVATLVFIFGIVRYIAAGGDPEKTKTARSFIVFSIVGLALILGIWGVATFLITGLGFDTTAPSNLPTFN